MVNHTLLRRNDTLQDQLTAILTDRIASGQYAPGTQLPSESALAAEFEVSRATVRGALRALVSRGMLYRRRGVGTYASQPSLISNPIGEAMDFHQLIAESGFQPGVELGRTAIVKAGTDLSASLSVARGSQLLRTEKVFTANGNPVIYVVNLIPAWVLGQELLQEAREHPEMTEPIYGFLEQRCRQRVNHHVATLWADLAENLDMDAPDIAPGVPILVMKSVAYSDGRPVFQSLSAYPDKRMQFRLVRYRTATG